jgi:nitroreductase
MNPGSSANRASSPDETLRPVRRVRQIREFTDESITVEELAAIADAARWSGSAGNGQPWRFILIRDVGTLRRLAEAGSPQTRSLQTASAAIAIALPDEKDRAVSRAYDEGRAAERILIAASFLGLGGGIAWIRSDARDAVREILDLPPDWLVRTIVALGHPSESARRPKSKPGEGRLPRQETVFEEHWPKS